MWGNCRRSPLHLRGLWRLRARMLRRTRKVRMRDKPGRQVLAEKATLLRTPLQRPRRIAPRRNLPADKAPTRMELSTVAETAALADATGRRHPHPTVQPKAADGVRFSN